MLCPLPVLDRRRNPARELRALRPRVSVARACGELATVPVDGVTLTGVGPLRGLRVCPAHAAETIRARAEGRTLYLIGTTRERSSPPRDATPPGTPLPL